MRIQNVSFHRFYNEVTFVCKKSRKTSTKQAYGPILAKILSILNNIGRALSFGNCCKSTLQPISWENRKIYIFGHTLQEALNEMREKANLNPVFFNQDQLKVLIEKLNSNKSKHDLAKQSQTENKSQEAVKAEIKEEKKGSKQKNKNENSQKSRPNVVSEKKDSPKQSSDISPKPALSHTLDHLDLESKEFLNSPLIFNNFATKKSNLREYDNYFKELEKKGVTIFIGPDTSFSIRKILLDSLPSGNYFFSFASVVRVRTYIETESFKNFAKEHDKIKILFFVIGSKGNSSIKRDKKDETDDILMDSGRNYPYNFFIFQNDPASEKYNLERLKELINDNHF